MAEGGGLPGSAGTNRGPGWYPVGDNPNDQAYWDGEGWTKRRRWAGAGWIESSESQSETPSDPRNSRGPSTSTAPPGPDRRSRRRALLAVVGLLAVIGVVVGVLITVSSGNPAGRAGPSPHGGPPSAATPVFHQPSLTALEQLVPGGVDQSSTIASSTEATTLCGVSVPSRLLAATVVGVPGSLADISALEFGFADPVAAQAYLHATGSTQPCLVTMPDGGQFQPVAYLETNDGIYEANGGTKYPSGPYEGAYKWSVIEYAAQGPDVFVVSIDTINGYTNDILPDVVLTTMEQPGGPNLIESPRSAHPGTIQAELVKAPYSLDVTPPPFGIDRTLNVSQFTNCPEAQIGTVLYNVIFENQMLNAGAAGVVVPGPGPQGTATVAWGSPVTLTVDSYGTNENESTFGCGGAHDSFNDNYVNVESMAAG